MLDKLWHIYYTKHIPNNKKGVAYMYEHVVVGRYNGYQVRFDGYNYYIRIKGRNFAIDYRP